MSYSPQTAKFADIALSIKRRLTASLNLDAAYVRIVASDSYKLLAEDRYIYIRYYGPSPRTDAGAGRWAMPVSRRVRVYLYIRDNNDGFSGDTTALTADEGMSAFEEQVLESLVQYTPLDASNTVLTIEPLHPVDSAGGPPERKPVDDVGFVSSYLDFECVYLLRVTQTHVP